MTTADSKNRRSISWTTQEWGLHGEKQLAVIASSNACGVPARKNIWSGEK